MNYKCSKCGYCYEAKRNVGSCKPCRRLYDQERYKADKGIGKSHSKEHYNRKLEMLKEIKKVPCIDCKMSYPHYVMDFDHLPGSTKVANVTRLLASGSISRFLAEIEKCEVVCANCHRERTYQRSISQGKDGSSILLRATYVI